MHVAKMASWVTLKSLGTRSTQKGSENTANREQLCDQFDACHMHCPWLQLRWKADSAHIYDKAPGVAPNKTGREAFKIPTLGSAVGGRKAFVRDYVRDGRRSACPNVADCPSEDDDLFGADLTGRRGSPANPLGEI